MNQLRYSIIHGNTTVVLKHAPEGWNDNLIEKQRSEKYHGFMTSFIAKLTFVKDGATLLRTIFFTHFPNYSQAYLKIEELDDVLLTYSQAFLGEIKFDTFIYFKQSVEVTVASTGLANLLKLNFSTSYNYPAPIVFNPMTDYGVGSTEALFAQDPDGSTNPTAYRNITTFLKAFFELLVTSGNGLGVNVSGITNPTTANGTFDSECNDPSGNYLYKGIYYYHPYYVIDNITAQYVLFFSTHSGGQWRLAAGVDPGYADDNETNYFYTNNVDFNTGGWNIAGGIWTGTPSFSRPTNIYAIDCSILDTFNDWIVLSLGATLFTPSVDIDEFASKVSISMEQLYVNLQSLLPFGLDIEVRSNVETLVLKLLPDVYKYSAADLIEDIGEISSDLKFSLYENAISSVKCGYNKKTYANTIDDSLEFNSSNPIFTINNPKFKKDFDMTNSWRADRVGMPWNGTSNDRSDEDMFFICIQSYGGTYKTFESNYVKLISDTSSLTAGSNIYITPRRCLERNKDLIASLSFGLLDNKYHYTPEEKPNTELSSKLNYADLFSEYNSVWLHEAHGLSITLATKLFLPFVFEFTGKTSNKFIANLNARQNGYIQFNYNNDTYKGFILSSKSKAKGKSKCKFKLLSTPDNDLTKLIK